MAPDTGRSRCSDPARPHQQTSEGWVDVAASMPTARPGTGAENFLDGSHVAEQRPCFCRGGIVAAVTLCAARTAMQTADATISPLKAPCPIESESDNQCQAGRGVAQVDALLPELEGSEVPCRVAVLAGFPCTCLTENASMSDAYRDIASRIALDRREFPFCAAEAASSNQAAMRAAPGKPAPHLTLEFATKG